MIVLDRYPVRELRFCITEGDTPVRRMCWRDASGNWRCEVCHPCRVEHQLEFAAASPAARVASATGDQAAQVLSDAQTTTGGASIFERAVATFGERAQILKALSEMAELATELHHYLEGKGDAARIGTEIADVLSTSEQLRVIFAPEVAAALPVQLGKLNLAIARAVLLPDDTREADRWARRNRKLEAQLAAVRGAAR